MKPITAEWAAKTEGDFATRERESRVRKHPNYDGICVHGQQCGRNTSRPRYPRLESSSPRSMT